ncbi:Putative membrane protein [Amycolatopsis japonica]|uniref:Putative membrane protein n=1 Tax=Amycolatopsis japonica TaxID=208439 RepID=A0A075UUB3_9PSEU|nr:hypothetical protein [Amycolatopsis japonica]AIG76021.1 Putative membrane protein [Amycolatopsis japonica]
MAESIDQREQPPIFRAQAVAHHRRGRDEKGEPPELPAPALRRLWVLLAALAAALLTGAATVPVTVYRQGDAIAVTGVEEPVVLVVVLPMSGAAEPAENAEVVLREGTVRGRVVERFSGLSRAGLTARFGIPAADDLPEPAVAAVVRLDGGTVRPGGRYPAWIEVGTAPLLARLTGRTDE